MSLCPATGGRRATPRTITGAFASPVLAPRKVYESPSNCGARRCSWILAGLTLLTVARICFPTSTSPSASNVPVQPAALELLAALSNVLAGWGRWYVFGAQAVIAYGVPRLSADVDVTVQLVPADPERFARDMEAAGFALRVDDPEFVRRTRVMPFVHLATAMPLDVVLAGSGLEDEFANRARKVDVGGTTVPLIDPEDLIIAKILAGRPKDLDDARGVWRVHGRTLDADRIQRMLQLLEEALSQSDLLPAFDAIRGSQSDRQ